MILVLWEREEAEFQARKLETAGQAPRRAIEGQALKREGRVAKPPQKLSQEL